MKKALIFLIIITSFMPGCSKVEKPKSSVNMEFYLVDRETKQEFLIVDVSNNEFKVFEYKVFSENGQVQKISPILENGKPKKVIDDIDEYYNSLLLLTKTPSLLQEDEKTPYYLETKDKNKDYGYELSILDYKNLGGCKFSTISDLSNGTEKSIGIVLLNPLDKELPFEKEKFTYKNKKFRELWENKGNGFEFVEHVDFVE